MEWLIIFLAMIWSLFLVASLAIGALVYVSRLKAQLSDFLAAWVAPGDDNSPSQLALVVKAAAAIHVEELKASLSGAMMGHASAMSKAVQGIESDVANDQLAGQNPMLAALLSFSPSLRKRLTKSPMAALALSRLDLSGLLKQSAGNNGNKQSSPSSFQLGL